MSKTGFMHKCGKTQKTKWNMLISSPARRSIRKLNTTFERNSNETNFDEFFKLCIFIMFATKKAICNIYAADFVNIYNNI